MRTESHFAAFKQHLSFTYCREIENETTWSVWSVCITPSWREVENTLPGWCVWFSPCSRVVTAAKWEQAKISEGTLKGMETNHRNETAPVQVILSGPGFLEIPREELDYQCGCFINDLFCLAAGMDGVSSAVTSQGVGVRAEFASFTRVLFFFSSLYLPFLISCLFRGWLLANIVNLLRGQHCRALEVWVIVHRQVLIFIISAVGDDISKTFAGCRVKKFSVDSASELHRGHVHAKLAMFDLQVKLSIYPVPPM